MYCSLAAVFCMLFSLRFGGDVGTDWGVAWLVATFMGAFIIQPMVAVVTAIVGHCAVWNFARSVDVLHAAQSAGQAIGMDV